MSIKHDLQHSIKKLYQAREHSYATQADRLHILNQFAKDLISLGYRLPKIQGLKQKHIEAVVKYWQEKGLSTATIKNRTACLRNLCDKLNKKNIIPSNDELRIGKRTYKPKENKAIFNPDFSKITNKYILISLQLQRVFGLRREESLKIKPMMADKGDKLELLPTWCKGGKGRTIPIRTEEQRHWLNEAKKLAGKFDQSLIPPNKNYIKQRRIYDKQVSRSGLKNLHGLRHAYAQREYKELTGWESPINGGPNSKQLTPDQKRIDHQARLILVELLGHSRSSISVNYISR